MIQAIQCQNAGTRIQFSEIRQRKSNKKRILWMIMWDQISIENSWTGMFVDDLFLSLNLKWFIKENKVFLVISYIKINPDQQAMQKIALSITSRSFILSCTNQFKASFDCDNCHKKIA